MLLKSWLPGNNMKMRSALTGGAVAYFYQLWACVRVLKYWNKMLLLLFINKKKINFDSEYSFLFKKGKLLNDKQIYLSKNRLNGRFQLLNNVFLFPITMIQYLQKMVYNSRICCVNRQKSLVFIVWGKPKSKSKFLSLAKI